MTNIVEVDSDQGPVLFEVDEISTSRTQRVSRGDKNVVAKLEGNLQDALDRIRPAASAVITTPPSPQP